MSNVRVCVIRAAGINCDRETLHAWSLAGAAPELVHVRALIGEPARLNSFGIVTIPGGFSYGDDLGAGRILAQQLHLRLGDALREFVGRGGLVLGICNGFQVLVKAGLLPGGDWGRARVTIVTNESGRFEDRWVNLQVASGRCPILEGLQRLYLPVAHGEGRIVAADEAAGAALQREDHVALRYVAEAGGPAGYPDNPNGSVDDIAGLTDATGRILGLMPHPERHVDRTQHPLWTRLTDGKEPDGLTLFRNAVRYFR